MGLGMGDWGLDNWGLDNWGLDNWGLGNWKNNRFHARRAVQPTTNNQ